MDVTPATTEPLPIASADGDVVDGGPVSPRRRSRFWLRIVIAIVVLAALGVAGRRYYGELSLIKSASPGVIAAIAALYVVGRWPPAILMRAALAALGHRIGRAETFFVLMAQYYVNTLIPRAGIGAVAGYFKFRRGVPVADLGAAQLLPLTLVQYACVGVAALACQAGLAAAGVAKFEPILAAVFTALAVVSFVPLLVPLPAPGLSPDKNKNGGFIGRFLGRLSDACRRLGKNWRLLGWAFVGQAVVLLVRAARVQLSFYAIGHPVNYWTAFVASAAADVMFLVSITPGALGFREGGIVYAARVMGTTGDVALAAAVLDRIVVTGCNLVLGQIGIWRYLGRSTAGVVVGAAGSSR